MRRSLPSTPNLLLQSSARCACGCGTAITETQHGTSLVMGKKNVGAGIDAQVNCRRRSNWHTVQATENLEKTTPEKNNKNNMLQIYMYIPEYTLYEGAQIGRDVSTIVAVHIY